MKKLISVLLSLALCCLLIPAVAETATLAGTWYISGAQSDGMEIQVVDPSAITVTINDDGTFAMSVPSMGVTQEGTWELGDGAINLLAGEETSAFQIDGDELLYDVGTAVIHLSRTPAEPVALPAVIGVESVEAFNGTWAPAAIVSYGLYGALTEEAAAGYSTLVIENGHVSLVSGGIEMGAYDFTLADGILSAQDSSFFTTDMSLILREDGALYYITVAQMGGMKIETTLIYAPVAE